MAEEAILLDKDHIEREEGRSMVAALRDWLEEGITNSQIES